MAERTFSIPPSLAQSQPVSYSSATDNPRDALVTTDSVNQEPYTIKCICDYADDDGNSIYCESCDTLEHIECFYAGHVEQATHENLDHPCADCNPRSPDGRKAQRQDCSASTAGVKRSYADLNDIDSLQHVEVSLCSACHEIFNQPHNFPRNYRYNHNNDVRKGAKPKTFTKSVHDIAISASSGCQLCILLKENLSFVHIYTSEINRSDFTQLKCDLYWNDELSVFTSLRCEVKESSSSIFFIMLLPETDSKDMALGQIRPPSTASEECSATAIQWLIDCLTTHEKCHTIDYNPWLPTRIIDIGSAWGSLEARLVITADVPLGKINYICLSHLWSAGNIVTLNHANIEEMKHGIPIDTLSSTFQEALHISRRLGVRYIWIDSLCILQDSLEDWAKESTEMGQIYQNSLCNIAAAASSVNQGGLFQQRDARLITPNRVWINYKGHKKPYAIFASNLFVDNVSNAYLNRRGWVFQERMLSTRTLHFASQLFWECRTLMACETFPAGLLTELNEYADHKGSSLPISLKNWYEEINREWTWNNLIEVYANCQLTRSSDRLTAIAGIAKQIQPYIGDEYIAGMWKRDLPRCLIWSLSNAEGSISRHLEYRCPSWSWASLDFDSVDIDFIHDGNIENILVDVIEARVVSASESIYSRLTGGYIVLRGRIDQISLANIPEEGDWNGNWSYKADFDVTHTSRNQDLFCLPILTHNNQPSTTFPSQTECLILKKAAVDVLGFERVGLIMISLDPEHTLPECLQWVVGFSNIVPTDSKCTTNVKIY